MNLKLFQQAFLKQITQIDNASEEVHPLLRIVGHDTRLTPYERLGIYVRDYRGRLFDVLTDHYPQTFRYLGEDGFLELFEAYLAEYPPSHFSLRYWGDALSEFCLQHVSYNRPELIDLVRFEWTIHDLYDGPDVPLLTPASLSQINPEQWVNLSFTLIPCLKLWRADTSVATFWRDLNDNKAAPCAHAADSHLVHWRRDCEVYFRELTQEEWTCLQRLSQGETVGDLCEFLIGANTDEGAPGVFSQYLQSWIADGMLQEAS